MSATRLRIGVLAAMVVGAAGWYGWTGTAPVGRPALATAFTPAPADGWTGRTAPDFSLPTLDARLVKLSDFRGKVVLLNFWATWCAPCRIEMPWLVDFHERYRAQGLEILGVSVNDGEADQVAKFAHRMKVNYPILLKDDAVMDAYGGVRFLPQTFFIGTDGRIIARSYGIRGRAEFEADIEQALGRRPPAS